MRVTIHREWTAEASLDGEWDGTRDNVYGLKVELEGNGQGPHDERIEISHGGVFFRVEPDGDGLAVSVVGVPVCDMTVRPRSANSIAVRGVRRA